MSAAAKNPRVQRPSLSQAVRTYFRGVPKGEMYLAEAEFGLRRIHPLLADLPSGARVLEVGSGPCILFAELVGRFPALAFQGIEPMAHGFAFFDDFVRRMRDIHPGISVHLGGYETFQPDKPFDVIFLVNVFEHLPDWRDFMSFVEMALSPSGKCIVLCPNYGFPYESHFRIPVVINKIITKAIFRRHIENFETSQGYEGLYDSLNFVKLRHVRREAARRGLCIDVDTSILEEMIGRLDNDPAFRARQGVLTRPTRILQRSGLRKYLARLRLVQDVLPYMQFTLSRFCPS